MNPGHDKKLYSLQYLRAIAAIGVVLVHASTTLEGREAALPLFHAGSYGVDLFFVISGFVMFYTTAEKAITPANFFLRRSIRILPIYFILTTVAFLLARFAPGLGKIFSAAPLDYVRSLLFIPYYNKYYDAIRPEVQQGWTLNFEMFFYVVFGFCLWLKPKARLWACIGLFSALTAFGIVVAPTGVFGKTYTDPIMLEFVFGVLIGYVLVLHEPKFSRLVMASLAATVIAELCVLGLGLPQRALFAGVPAVFLVSGFILLERRGSMPYLPFLVLLGDASYSLYLIHGFALSALKRVFVHVVHGNAPVSQLMFMAGGLVLSILVALVFFRTVEDPITRTLQGMTRKKRLPSASRVDVPIDEPASDEPATV